AMRNAIALRSPAGTVCHSDRGGQFRAKRTQRLLANNGLVGSMGRVGAAGGNAAMEMLLSVSSGHWRGFEESEEVAGVVALEAAHRFAFGLALAGAAGDVVLGRLVVLRASQDDGVQRPVQLAVAVA